MLHVACLFLITLCTYSTSDLVTCCVPLVIAGACRIWSSFEVSICSKAVFWKCWKECFGGVGVVDLVVKVINQLIFCGV